jgi:hypothetical protein
LSNKKSNGDNAESILKKCIQALRGEISIDTLNIINSIYGPLRSEIKKGRYDDVTVEIYSQSAEIIERKVNNLLNAAIGKVISSDHKFYTKIMSLNDDHLSNSIEFYQDIPQFSIPLTEKYVLKGFEDLVINRSEQRKYEEEAEKVEFTPTEQEIRLIEEEIKNLYDKISNYNKKRLVFKELLDEKTWEEASSYLILLTYLAHQGKIDMKQKNFPDGEIIIDIL